MKPIIFHDVVPIISYIVFQPVAKSKPFTDKLRKDGVYIQGIVIGESIPTKLAPLTGGLPNLIYVKYPALLVPAHTYIHWNIRSCE